jgi:hypothetical protein
MNYDNIFSVCSLLAGSFVLLMYLAVAMFLLYVSTDRNTDQESIFLVLASSGISIAVVTAAEFSILFGLFGLV